MRRAVLGYCTAVMLGDRPNGQAYIVMDAFREPTFSTGWAGVAMAAWEACAENSDVEPF